MLAPTALNAQSVKEFTYDSKGKRDPFVSLIGGGKDEGADERNAGEYRVEGIIFDPGKESLTVINGKVLKEGDSIGPYKVVKIEKTSVLLSKQDEVFSLRLKSHK